jgi:citrate synthase
VFELTGRRPSVDFALVALRRCLGLPDGAAFDLFAAGRSIGWIAQALEQRADGTLIRPRAVYVGPRPKSIASVTPPQAARRLPFKHATAHPRESA